MRHDHYHREFCNCGGSTCDRWILQRLSTVAETVDDLRAQGIEERDVLRLTGLEKDINIGPYKAQGQIMFGYVAAGTPGVVEVLRAGYRFPA